MNWQHLHTFIFDTSSFLVPERLLGCGFPVASPHRLKTSPSTTAWTGWLEEIRWSSGTLQFPARVCRVRTSDCPRPGTAVSRRPSDGGDLGASLSEVESAAHMSIYACFSVLQCCLCHLRCRWVNVISYFLDVYVLPVFGSENQPLWWLSDDLQAAVTLP